MLKYRPVVLKRPMVSWAADLADYAFAQGFLQKKASTMAAAMKKVSRKWYAMDPENRQRK